MANATTSLASPPLDGGVDVMIIAIIGGDDFDDSHGGDNGYDDCD